MIQICFIIFSSGSTTCFGCCYHQNLCCSVHLQHFSVSHTQTYTLCKYTLGHNHTGCACVYVCVCVRLWGIFSLPFPSCLSVELTLIRVEMTGSLCAGALTCFCTADCYQPEKWSRVTLFISFRFRSRGFSLIFRVCLCVHLLFSTNLCPGRKKKNTSTLNLL